MFANQSTSVAISEEASLYQNLPKLIVPLDLLERPSISLWVELQTVSPNNICSRRFERKRRISFYILRRTFSWGNNLLGRFANTYMQDCEITAPSRWYEEIQQTRGLRNRSTIDILQSQQTIDALCLRFRRNPCRSSVADNARR